MPVEILEYTGSTWVTVVPIRSSSPVDPFVLGITEPTPSNTGYRETPTTTATGTVTLTTGQTYSGVHLTGRIVIPQSATGTIIIEDCLIDASGISGTNQLNIIDVHPSTGATVIIRFNEVKGRTAMIGIGVRRFYAYRNYIHHVEDGFRIHNYNSTGVAAANVTIEGCRIDQLIVRVPDPNQTRTDLRTHSDGIQIEGCDGIIIRGVSIDAMASTDGTSNIEWANNASPYASVAAGTSGARPHPQASQGIMLSPNVSAITNLLIEKCWIRGGEQGINGGSNNLSTATGVITACRFDRNQWHVGWALNLDANTGITESGNTYIDDGSTVVRRFG